MSSLGVKLTLAGLRRRKLVLRVPSSGKSRAAVTLAGGYARKPGAIHVAVADPFLDPSRALSRRSIRFSVAIISSSVSFDS